MDMLSVASPEFDRIANLMPDCCIIGIEKIKQDHKAFDKCIAEFYQNKTPVIVEMFHGTKSQYVDRIIEEGLKSSYNVTSAFGKGTYFSPNIKLSLNSYTDKNKSNELSYVFLCDVIKDNTKGNGVDIFVCPRDDSFMIKYLISFYKNAS